MKFTIHYYYLILSFFIISCSGSKEVATTEPASAIDYDTYENEYYIKKSKNAMTPLNPETSTNSYNNVQKAYQEQGRSNAMVESREIDLKVNEIIRSHTGKDMTNIARSDVFDTKTGYEWKFTNVETGQSFRVITDYNFENVNIIQLSSLSDF